MKWMSTPSIFGHELWEGIELCLCLPPVVVAAPVPNQLLQRPQLHALGAVCNEFFGRPAGLREAPAEVIDRGLRHFHGEGLD